MRKKIFRRQYFVKSELQFWFVLILILVVSIEAIFFGYGISYLLTIASDWQRPHVVFDFFKILILILLLLIAVNFILGIYFSHKIAGPLFRLHRILREIREGKVPDKFYVRRGDVFKDFFREFNEVVLVLNKLNRDKEHIKQALGQLNQCQEILDRKHSVEELKKVQKMFSSIKNLLIADS